MKSGRQTPKRRLVNMPRLLAEGGIAFYEHGEDPHAGRGWIQMACPFCGDGEPHLGWNQERQWWRCWACGKHSTIEAVKALLRVTGHQAGVLLQKHAQGPLMVTRAATAQGYGPKAVVPPAAGPLGPGHREYLRRRRYDPDAIVAHWGVRGCGLSATQWSNRLLIPIRFHGQLINHMGRALNKRAKPPYCTPPPALCLSNHKDSVYGWDEVPGDGVVVVEGVLDVWRLGPGAVGTYGTGWTLAQVALLATKVHRYVMYDATAAVEGRALANALAGLPGHTELLKLPDGDPDDLSNKEAAKLMQELHM